MLNKIKRFLFENQNQEQTLAKNTFWLFFGQTSGRLLRAALIIYAARVLGPESWGAFSYVMSLVAFLLILSDIGISAIVTRESARNPEAAAEYFSTAFFLKIGLLILSSTALLYGSPYLSEIPETKNLLALIVFVLIFDSLRNFGFAISRATENMQWEALNEIVTNLAITGIGFYALSKSASSEHLTYAYIFGTGLGLLAMAFTVRNYLPKIFTHFNPKLIREIISSSLPFAFASFLGAIMINTDLIMLGWMRSPEEIGFYSAAQKPIQLLYTMAGLFATSLFPAISRISAATEPERLKKLLEKSLVASLFVAIPTVVVGLPLSKEIVSLLYGQEYLPAILPFQVLLITLLIIFPSVIVSNSLLAQNQQKKFITFSLIGAIGNIFFNFLLIPKFGIFGSAVSTLTTQILANAFIWHKMNSVVSFKISDKIRKITFASVACAVLVIEIQNLNSPVILTIFLSAGAYFLILYALKEPALVAIKN